MAAKTAPPVTVTLGDPNDPGKVTAISDGKPVFDWSSLAAPVAMPTRTTTGDIKVNVLETVPEAIRERAERSLTINVERVKAVKGSTAKRPRIDYHWELQPVAHKDMAEAFVKLVTKYAKYRPSDKDIPHAGPNSPKGQVTARCGTPDWYRKLDDDTYTVTAKGTSGAFLAVRYSVRPFEQRGTTSRLPGTAA